MNYFRPIARVSFNSKAERSAVAFCRLDFAVANDGRITRARRRGASNGAGEAAYLIRNKYSCHIPGAGWCQVFDCYPTPHVRARDRANPAYPPRMFQRSFK